MTTHAIEPPAPERAWPYPLYQLTLAVAAARKPEDIFDAALQCLEESLGIERSSVLLFDAHGVMRFRAWRGLSDTYRAAVDGHSPWTPETTDAAPVLVEDVVRDESLASLLPVFAAEGIAALAFVPLAIGSKLLGKFMLYYPEPHVFDDHEVMTAQTIAAHVAFAIDQQEHRESERRYRDLLDCVGVAVYTTDADGYITFYNDEAAKLWGREPEVGVERWCGSFRIFTPEGDPIPLETSQIGITLRTGQSPPREDVVAERPDGTRVQFMPHPSAMFNAQGEIIGAVNVLVDVTARREAEAALEEKEARLFAAMQELEAVIAARDATIRHSELVQAQLASLIEASGGLISTRSGDQAVGRTLGRAVDLLGADAYAIWSYAEDRRQWEITDSYGLSPSYVSGSAVPATEGPRTLDAAMVVEDVQSHDGIAHLRHRYTAEGIRSMFVCPIDIGGDAHGTLAFYYRSPHQFTELEVRVGVALANLASAALTSARLLESTERARGELERANDALERTAADLRIANAAKDEFLSLVSHELRTPLTTIRGNAGVLFRSHDRLDEESRAGALSDIVAESERLHRIIENLLLLARAEGGQALQAEPLLLIRVVHRVINRHRQHHPERTFEIREHEAPRPIVFSEALLEQVVENLVSNAEKYSPASEPIIIDLVRTDEEVQARVLDAGGGVTEDEALRLFDPFYRTGAATRQAEGLGIGLAVCKRLIEAQGGRIWAHSRPDGGSEFGFALPVTDAEDLGTP